MSYTNPYAEAYNPYAGVYNPFQPPVMPQYQHTAAPAPQTQQTAPQAMTYPTIHADIVQTDDEGVIERWGVSQDKPQMFIDRAESRITVKSITGSGVTLDIYDKRPPVPPEPRFDPREYVRRDELPELVAAAVAAQRRDVEE